MARSIIHDCRSCVYGPDSYEVDADGKCITCGGSKKEEIDSCDGCEATDTEDLAMYLVEFHDGGSGHCVYCDDCRDLAKMDWNGETKSITRIADVSRFEGSPVVGERVAVVTRLNDGRESRSSGIYRGVRASDWTGEPVHFFEDGEINGVPQRCFATPVAQFTEA